MKAYFTNFQRLWKLPEWYAGVLQRHPFIILIVSGTLSLFLTILGVLFGPTPTLNPIEGVETRGTALSSARLMWEHLKEQADFGENRLNTSKTYSRVANYTDKVRYLAEADVTLMSVAFDEHWAELLMEHSTDSPCLQLKARGTFMPFLVQVVLKVDSAKTLLSMPMLQKLCDFESRLEPMLETFVPITPYRHMWTIANYAVCSSHSTVKRNCSDLTQKDVDTLRKSVTYCASHHSQDIITCSKEAFYGGVHKHIAPDYHIRYAECARQLKIAANCTRLERDIIFKLVSTGSLTSKNEAVYVNVYLPVFGLAFYADGGSKVLERMNQTEPPFPHYQSLQTEIERFWKDESLAKIVGLNLGIKKEIFQLTFLKDMVFGLVAFLLVSIILLVISGSLFYTLMVGLSVVFSIGVAFFLYGIVFGIHFFPTMNQMVLVLLIGIGADDTFILSHILRRSQGELAEIGEGAFRLAFGHAALAMFVTSATTAASFAANIFSDLVVIKCFGVFAGTTMIVNYFLVVTWLPAAHVILQDHINPYWRRTVGSKFDWCTRVREQVAYPARKLLHELLPQFVAKLDVMIICFFGVLMVTSGIIAFAAPGLQLPVQNPNELFIPSHKYEWYDDNSKQLFPALHYRYENVVNVSLVWGFKPVENAGKYDPENSGKLERDYTFTLNNSRALWELRHICQEFSLMYTIQHTFDCWTDRFWKWSENQTCSGRSTKMCCNITNPEFQWKHLNGCMVAASKQMTRPLLGVDHPIFLNRKNVLVGYIIHFGTNMIINFTYATEKAMFKDVRERVEIVAGRKRDPALRNYILITNQPLIMEHYDLLRAILQGTPIAVLFSTVLALAILVVFTRSLGLSLLSILSILGIISTTLATIVLLDWRVSLPEATIIVLVVGLSFDYTLHYAVAYKVITEMREKLGEVEENSNNIRDTFESISMPVAHSALTTFVAGLAMLPASTKFLYEIGVFMCMITIYGWLYASVFFMALLSVLDGKRWKTMKEWKTIFHLEARNETDGMAENIIPTESDIVDRATSD